MQYYTTAKTVILVYVALILAKIKGVFGGENQSSEPDHTSSKNYSTTRILNAIRQRNASEQYYATTMGLCVCNIEKLGDNGLYL